MRTKLIVVLTAFAAITAVTAIAVLFSIDSQKPGTDLPSQTALSSGAEVSGQPAPAASVAKAHLPGGATREGIKIHGDWVIEVRDPDGTLVSRREFKNTFFGADTLAKFLARDRLIGEWILQLSSSGEKACLNLGSTPVPCIIVETPPTASFNEYFPTLTVSQSSGQVTLSGTATAQRDGDITQVNSRIYHCDPASPTSCSQTDFTAKALASSSVTVATGQSILVTLTISFS